MALSEAEIAWRDKGIGGSDARTIAEGTGNDWAKLKAEKVDGVRPVFSKQQRFLMDMGTAVEPVILDYCDANVTRVAKRNVQATMAADGYFRCTLDGMTLIGQPIECKFHTGAKDIGDLVEYYWAQLQHEMLVTQQKSLLLCVGFGQWGRFDSEIVEHDRQYQSHYMTRALQFKEYCWSNGRLPEGMSESEADGLMPSVPRLRDHVWPVGDNTIGPLARQWMAHQEHAEVFSKAMNELKKQVPEDCRSATWVDGQGIGIRISINRAGSKSIKPYVGKA